MYNAIICSQSYKGIQDPRSEKIWNELACQSKTQLKKTEYRANEKHERQTIRHTPWRGNMGEAGGVSAVGLKINQCRN